MRHAKEEFDEGLASDLDEHLGDESGKYSIKTLQSTVLNIRDLENSDKAHWSVLTDLLVKTLNSERGRISRIDAWNKRQK